MHVLWFRLKGFSDKIKFFIVLFLCVFIIRVKPENRCHFPVNDIRMFTDRLFRGNTSCLLIEGGQKDLRSLHLLKFILQYISHTENGGEGIKDQECCKKSKDEECDHVALLTLHIIFCNNK